MPWQTQYQSRLTTAEKAVALVGPAETVFVGGNAATPRVICRALARRAVEVFPDRASGLKGVRVAHVLMLGEDPFAQEKTQGLIRHLSFFVGPADREAVNEGRAEYVPCNLSEIPALLRGERPKVDVALLMTSPPDRHGFLSLGVEVMASLAAAEIADRVIVQVNPRMPRTYGNAFLHVSDVDAIVEAEEELIELPDEAPTEEERRIAAHIAPLIPEGATLQLGIGGVPNAVLTLLEDRDDLGIHSEMISDAVMRAVESGIVTGRFKTRHGRKVVSTFCLGSRSFYDWLHENAIVEVHPCDHTNLPISASQNHRLTSINSALSVDLTGQVNADSIGPRIYSGVGGQVDFVRAATLSTGGRSFIALPATAKHCSVSRIVSTLATGAGVVTTRADVHAIVTEYGVAELHGRSLPERAEALIAIAHPKFRDDLRKGCTAALRASRV
jgi:4-hydroxybutyrate CoA-transferase